MTFVYSKISSDVAGKSFLDQFLILYTIEVQKTPISRLINSIVVDKSLHLHVILSAKSLGQKDFMFEISSKLEMEIFSDIEGSLWIFQEI